MKDSLKLAIRQEIREAIQTEMVALEQRLTKIIEGKFKNIKSVFEGFIGAIVELDKKVEQNEQFKLDLEKKVMELQKENEEIKENFKFIDGQMDLIQAKLKQNAIRLRGIPEEGQGRLIDLCSRILAQLINAQPLDISLQIEKIYRVNSQTAKQNNLPRDIVIYFKNKGLRDEIVQMSYNRDIQMQSGKVWVFKEIPFKILMQRKRFFFLTNELKNRQIRYKWEIPLGLSLTYQGEKYFLNTIQKAEDFYKDLITSGKVIRPELEQDGKLLLPDINKVQKAVLPVLEDKKNMKINNKIKPSLKSDRLNTKAKNQKEQQEKASEATRQEDYKHKLDVDICRVNTNYKPQKNPMMDLWDIGKRKELFLK